MVTTVSLSVNTRVYKERFKATDITQERNALRVVTLKAKMEKVPLVLTVRLEIAE